MKAREILHRTMKAIILHRIMQAKTTTTVLRTAIDSRKVKKLQKSPGYKKSPGLFTHYSKK